jgi:uncharacterized HAD superfamily protein
MIAPTIMSNYRQKIVLVDVDGTLCTGVCWTAKECLNAKPRKDIIEKVNKLFKENLILIHTARQEDLLPATLQWLRKHGVMFHGWATGKKPADLYIDDHAIRPEEL